MARRLLIVDAKATNRIALKAALVKASYRVVAVASGRAALAEARLNAPDLVLADASLPDLDTDTLCRGLGAGIRPDAPPVLILGEPADVKYRLACLRAGAEGMLIRPLDNDWLLAHIRSLLRARGASAELRRRDAAAGHLGFSEIGVAFSAPARIALISGRRDAAAVPMAVLTTALRKLLPHRIEVMSPMQALAESDGDLAPVPEVFVLTVDGGPDGDSGAAVLSELRSRPETRRAAILALHDGPARAAGARALDLGANDLADRRAEPAELALRIARQLKVKRDFDRLRATVDEGLRMAAIDPLTGLYNRRYAMRHLADLANQTDAGQESYALLIADIDHFKKVNDNYGHPAGDAVLSQVAMHLRDNLRGVDLVARMGGEEFLIVLPRTDLVEARAAAERLLESIAKRRTRLPCGDEIDVTLSIGLAVPEGERVTAEAMIEAADRALYRAKATGRNRVVATAGSAQPDKPKRRTRKTGRAVAT